MKAKQAITRLGKRDLDRLHREHVASRKRVARACARGEDSKEVCLAKVIGPALFLPLDFSQSGTPAEYES